MQMDSLLFAVHSMGKFVGWYGSTRFTAYEFHQQWVSAGDCRRRPGTALQRPRPSCPFVPVLSNPGWTGRLISLRMNMIDIVNLPQFLILSTSGYLRAKSIPSFFPAVSTMALDIFSIPLIGNASLKIIFPVQADVNKPAQSIAH